ncbi:MAG: hypothetical protein CM15mP22_8020 [Gammaproteobacteria bacterium]|nr:MAG: hypothetical protein CM15mP22_8020 [Gammaproteobacteria bacterium]
MDSFLSIRCPELHDIYGKEFETKYTEYEKKAEAGEIKHFKTLEAKDLWKKILSMLFETGHPWVTFKDPCNIRLLRAMWEQYIHLIYAQK